MAEYDISSMLGTEVRHAKYGTGIVMEVEGTHLCVDFKEFGKKKFRYPDAFETFLEVEKEETAAKIARDLAGRKEEEDYINRKRSQDLYNTVKEFGEKKAAEHERKKRQQIERQRQSQMMREQKMHSINTKKNK